MIVVSGAAHLVLEPGDTPADPLPFLPVRKTRKYMGVQDDLAVVCAGRALAQAELAAPLGQLAGLFLAVGYIPFQERDMIPVLEGSLVDGAFDHQRFAAEGCHRAHPLLTFRCLPNMPAYHVSASFGVRGPYFVTYPGPAQLYQALDEAAAALETGAVELALVGGVAHQRNFLVEHHHARIEPPQEAATLRDAGAFAVLETEAHARERGARVLARLRALTLAYEPFDACTRWPHPSESFSLDDVPLAAFGKAALGAPALMAALSQQLNPCDQSGLPAPTGSWLRHQLRSRDGLVASSQWELPA